MIGDGVELLRTADIDVVAKLHARCFYDSWDSTMISQVLDMNGAFGFVARRAGYGSIIGFALSRIAADECELLSLGVAPEHRARGIGAKLLRDAMARREWEFSLPGDSEWHVADGAAILASSFGDYISSQSVGVKLCDDSVFPIIEAGQRVDYVTHSATFGLLEDTNNARFVFVESQDGADGRLTSMDRNLGYLVVPAYGFSNEAIHLESRIDEDLLLRVVARSLARAEKHTRDWAYPELRFSYALPEPT